MDLPDLPVSCTCVRIPTLRARAEAITIETEKAVDVAVVAALNAAEGVTVVDDQSKNLYPMPVRAEPPHTTSTSTHTHPSPSHLLARCSPSLPPVLLALPRRRLCSSPPHLLPAPLARLAPQLTASKKYDVEVGRIRERCLRRQMASTSLCAATSRAAPPPTPSPRPSRPRCARRDGPPAGDALQLRRVESLRRGSGRGRRCRAHRGHAAQGQLSLSLFR